MYKFKEVKTLEIGVNEISKVIIGITEDGEVYRCCYNDGKHLTWIKIEMYNNK
jgi:hypothetical protein